MELLQEFDFDLKYVKGKENVVADALSRRPIANAISCVQIFLMDEIKMDYIDDEFFNILFESLSKEARTANKIEKFKSFELKDEILYYNGKVCVPKFGEHRFNIINNLRDIIIAIHPNFQKINMDVKRHYYWPGMKIYIKEYVERCFKCQITKAEQVKDPWSLQPLGVPNLKFESISIDFIVGLPRIQSNFDGIMVVVERLTKIARLIPTITIIIAYGVAELFMRDICKHHGIS